MRDLLCSHMAFALRVRFLTLLLPLMLQSTLTYALTPEELLFESVKVGNLQEVTRLLNEGVSPNSVNNPAQIAKIIQEHAPTPEDGVALVGRVLGQLDVLNHEKESPRCRLVDDEARAHLVKKRAELAELTERARLAQVAYLAQIAHLAQITEHYRSILQALPDTRIGSEFDLESIKRYLLRLALQGNHEALNTLRELQAVYPPTGSGVPLIGRCCNAVQVNASHKMTSRSDGDPYVTGSSHDTWKYPQIEALRDFSYKPEPTLGSKSSIPHNVAYDIPPKRPLENDNQYEVRRVAEIEQNLHRRLSFAGKGAMSWVYFVHDHIPDAGALKALYPEITADFLKIKYPTVTFERALEKHWVSETSKEVVKIRRLSPWGRGAQSAIEMTRTDLAIEKVFESCADRFKEIDAFGKEHVLIRVAPVTSSVREISRGVFRQRTVAGPTAWDLASRVNSAVFYKNKSEEHYLINTLGFKSLAEAQKKLALLEKFYAETHYDVIHFRRQNNLVMMRGQVGPDLRSVSVGFDYNQGRNVIWNVKDQVFDAIDW